MADLPLQVIEIEADDVAAARMALHKLESLRSLAQLGLRLHALIAPSEPDAQGRVQQLLAESNVPAVVRKADASLEDVFVGATLASAGSKQVADVTGPAPARARGGHEGAAPNVARPPDARHGGRDPAVADDDLWLRHQLRRSARPHRCGGPGQYRKVRGPSVADIASSQVIDIVGPRLPGAEQLRRLIVSGGGSTQACTSLPISSAAGSMAPVRWRR